MGGLNYRELGLKVGIELHRQLNVGGKLFCDCKYELGDKPQGTFTRVLRPTESELGEVDPAAKFEASRGLEIIYHYGLESTCLVEADEEPPHDVNMSAIETALMIALLLDSKPVDEIHVMRKIVIDGSNTTGFQRTMVIALGGRLKVGGRTVGVQTITLEEDAARLIGSPKKGVREYDLSRLGVPLIEVSLEPIEVVKDAREVVEVAEALGKLLKSTGRVARGIGTVRQDLNISIRGSGIIEVKGVQELPLIAKVVDYEAKRLYWLTQLAERVRGRGVRPDNAANGPYDVTDILSRSGSKLVKRLIEGGAIALAVLARGFSGLLSEEPYPDVRLGKELADIAKAYGLGGVLHSDELPGYGIAKREVDEIRRRVKAGEEDAFVIVIGESELANQVAKAIIERLRAAVVGPPSETRAATPDGKTKYLRPRPGAARMYPETDLPPIRVDDELIDKVRSMLPPPWHEQVNELCKKYGISRELAEEVLDSEHYDVFINAVEKLKVKPTIAAVTITETLTALRREGLDISKVSGEQLLEVLRLVSTNEIAKEVIPDVLRAIMKEGLRDVRDAVKRLGLKRLSEEELREIVRSVVRENIELVKSRGERSFGPLMGIVMSKVRGRADGSMVSRVLKDLIKEAIMLKDVDT